MNFYAYLAHLEETLTPFALVTIVEASVHSPGRTAFKMCVTEDGHVEGSIGGGGLEYKARNTALEMLRSGEASRLVTYHLTSEEDGGIGMACGGDAQVFIETIAPRRQLVIFGGGHIGSALARYAHDVGFEVTIYDDRPEFAASHPCAHTQVCEYTQEGLGALSLPRHAFFVIVTHKHVGDRACLEALLRHDGLEAAYIGLIGSSKKLAVTFNTLMEQGISREALEGVHAPIGVDHGGQTANEIAIAITTELIAVRHDKKLQDTMSAKKHPIMAIPL